MFSVGLLLDFRTKKSKKVTTMLKTEYTLENIALLLTEFETMKRMIA